jgi:Resolvase, N terminal domain
MQELQRSPEQAFQRVQQWRGVRNRDGQKRSFFSSDRHAVSPAAQPLSRRITTNKNRLAMANVGYARVSTEEQNLDMQRFALRAGGCERIFEDLGVSAIAERRLGFDAALETLKPGDVFVVWKLDRAFRSLKQSIHTLERFENQGIAFRSLTEYIDTS